MNYCDARSRIRSGDLLGFTHRPWWPWHDFKVQMVRMATRSEYAHVATAVRMKGRVWAIEAVKPYPRIVPLSNLLPADWVQIKAPWRAETEEAALKLIGKHGERYSEWEAVRGFFGKVVPGADSNWMCAEYTWLIAKMDDIVLGEKITPTGLIEAAKRLGPLNLLDEAL